MRTIMLIMMMMFLSAEAVSGPTAKTLWRWRNDDGDIEKATWIDTANVPAVYQKEGNIRLRILVRDAKDTVRLNWSSSPYMHASAIVTASDTGAVYLAPSMHIADGRLYSENCMLPLWGYPYQYSYGGTITVDSSSCCLLSNTGKTAFEIEYSLRPGAAFPQQGVVYLQCGNERTGWERYPAALQLPPLDWQTLNSVNVDAIEQLIFADENNGWMTAYITGEPEGSYLLMKTTDGGRTWSVVKDPCFRVFCAGKDTLWAVTFDDAGKQGLCRTTDGGLSWKNFYQSANIGPMSFLTPRCGWIHLPDEFVFLKTVDGGQTWRKLRHPTMDVNCLQLISESTGCITGSGGIFRTSDGAETWSRVSSVGYLTEICFVDSISGWAFGQRGQFLGTHDAGATWTAQDFPVSPPLRVLHFADSLNGWGAGDEGMIIATQDGGRHWTRQKSGTGYNLISMSVINNHVWIGGDGGVLLTSTTGGWTAVNEHATRPLSREFTLYPNYPNPFNPTTTIRYALPRATHVVVAVYDVLGRKVSMLVDESKPAGTYEAVWNASRYASGMYLCRISAGEFVQTRMMALLK